MCYTYGSAASPNRHQSPESEYSTETSCMPTAAQRPRVPCCPVPRPKASRQSSQNALAPWMHHHATTVMTHSTNGPLTNILCCCQAPAPSVAHDWWNLTLTSQQAANLRTLTNAMPSAWRRCPNRHKTVGTADAMTDSMYRHRPHTKTLVASELLNMNLCAASKTVQRPARIGPSLRRSKPQKVMRWSCGAPHNRVRTFKTLRALLSSRLLKNG